MNDLLRVLLVEDNPGDADLIMELLPRNRTTQFEVENVSRLSLALESVGSGRFNIILLDLGLPDSDGLATLRAMRRQVAGLPIIVMTGNNDESTGLEAIREGAQDYLIKGQTDEYLLARSIKYSVERKQAENALKELNDTLEERVIERTAQITLANETLLIEITERKQAEDALRESEQRYRKLFESLQEGFYLAQGIYDNNGSLCDAMYIDANPAFERIMGMERNQLIGKRITELVPNIKREWFEIFGGVIVSGEPASHCAYSETFDRYFEALVFKPFPGQFGVLVTDISERKQTEMALHKLNEELENRVKERTAELRDKDQILLLQSRQAAMGEMIGNIAHQWRQPLNTLGLFTQSIGYFYGTPKFDKEFLDKSVAKSMEIIQYMSHTIDDFRNFFSTEREKSNFSIDEAVSRALTLVGASFEERNIKIDKKTREDIKINGFPNEYGQVLLNILINARDVITERNIKSPLVKISIRSENGASVVTIADNGGGIPDDIVDKIFDPYFTTKGPQHGTGVGLFMSKAIIEKNMGGRLTARNIDLGAEFRIEV